MRVRWILSVVAFMFIIALVGLACGPTISEEVAPKVAPSLQDNGQNFLVVDSPRISVAVEVLQAWVDKNPCKKIVTFSSDSSGTGGAQLGWLVYYESRENCKE